MKFKSPIQVLIVIIGCLSLIKAQNDIVASTLTITSPDPRTGGFVEDSVASVTFTLAYTVTGTGATPNKVEVYFSDAGGTTKTNPVIEAGGDNAPDGLTVVSEDGSFDDLTATITLDDTNCAAYTKFCALIDVTGGSTGIKESCVDFGLGTDKAGTKACAVDDIVASTLTVTTPDPTSGGFSVGVAVDTTFTLAYTVTSGGSVTPTGVKVYFSNNDGSKKTNPEVTAGGSNAPDGTDEITSSASFIGLTAKLTLDAANCADYSKLCTSITVTDIDDTNNEICNDFGADGDKAGTKDCTAAVVTTASPTTADSGVGVLSISRACAIIMILAVLVV